MLGIKVLDGLLDIPSSSYQLELQKEVSVLSFSHPIEVTRSMMMSMNIPKHLWGQVVLTAI
jgi:hypothetical protein